MKFDIQELSPVTRQVAFEIPSSKVDKLVQETYKQLSKEVRIKGFRPGKAPRRVLEQMPRYRNFVQDEVLKKLHEESVQEFLSKTELHVLSLPKTDASKPQQGQDYSFTLEVEILPTIDLSPVKEWTVPFESVEIENTDIHKALEQEQEKFATLEPIEDRPSQERDQVKIDYQVFAENENEKINEKSDQICFIGEQTLPKEVEHALIGRKIGETFTAKIGDDTTTQETWTITLKEIKEKNLPEIDDDLAKDAEYESLADMRTSLKEKLCEQEKKVSENRSRTKMIDLICEKIDIPIPANYLTTYIERKAKNTALQLKMMTNNQIDLDPKTLEENLKDEAIKELKLAIITQQASKDFSIEISEQDIDDEIEKIAERQNRNIAVLKSMYNEKERESLKGELKQTKAIDHLWEKALHQLESITKQARDLRIEQENKQEKEDINSQSDNNPSENTASESPKSL